MKKKLVFNDSHLKTHGYISVTCTDKGVQYKVKGKAAYGLINAMNNAVAASHEQVNV